MKTENSKEIKENMIFLTENLCSKQIKKETSEQFFFI